MQPRLQSLAQHEAGLRHRAFGRVDEHQGPVGHAQNPLHLAAEIGMARGVDDVDLHALPFHRDVLGKNGDAAFFFQIVGIQNAFARELAGAKLPALPEETVNQSRLAMIDVGDDGDIANVVATDQVGRGGIGDGIEGHGDSRPLRDRSRRMRGGVGGRPALFRSGVNSVQ